MRVVEIDNSENSWARAEWQRRTHRRFPSYVFMCVASCVYVYACVCARVPLIVCGVGHVKPRHGFLRVCECNIMLLPPPPVHSTTPLARHPFLPPPSRIHSQSPPLPIGFLPPFTVVQRRRRPRRVSIHWRPIHIPLFFSTLLFPFCLSFLFPSSRIVWL